MRQAVGGGEGKVKENKTISYMENRLIPHWALIEMANALQRQHNPDVKRQLHVVKYQIINANWTAYKLVLSSGLHFPR